MPVRITTLSENAADIGEFLGEWGLSILVETETSRVLLDTGHTISAVHNASALGIDLSTVNKIVLSHGHGDHSGGLREVLQRTGRVEVIAHPSVWASKYARIRQQDRYMAIPFSREALESLGATFNLTREPVQISDDIMTTGEIAMTTDYEAIDEMLYLKEGDSLLPDPLADDLALVVRTELGLALIAGCAHRGIINTVRHVQKLNGGEYIHSIIGGFHLFRASQEQIKKTIRDLKELGVQRLGPCHCTGFRATAELAREFGEIFFENHAGTQVTLD